MTVVANGQSLCRAGGANKLPRGARAVSVEAPDPHLLMLDTGALGPGRGTIVDADIGALVPIRENPKRGESQGTGLLRLLQTLAETGGRGARDYLYLCSGDVGRNIEQLGPGTRPWRNALEQLSAARRLARERGEAGLRVVAVTWSQGEEDRKRKLFRDAYRDLLLRHARRCDRDFRRLTGQSEPVWTVIDQLCAKPSGRGASPVALAQVDAMEQGSRVTISCPRYFFGGRAGFIDSVHLRPLGYTLLGEYHAKAIDRLRRAQDDRPDVLLGEVETCLRPDRASFRREGATIRFALLGATGPVVVDTVSLAAARHFGFEWVPADGSGAIDSVTIEDGAVRIDLSEAGPGTLRYAYDAQPTPVRKRRSHAWGNIRDSDPTPSIAAPGLKLHNWLIVFDAAIP